MPEPVAVSLSPEQLRPLDRTCDRFEQAWIDGQRPIINDYLRDTADELRHLVREELIRLELEWRCRQGEQPAADEYAGRFPEFAADVPAWIAEAQAAAEALAASTCDAAAAVSTQDVLDTPAGQATHPAAAQALETMPVRRLGEYELLQPLGEGGMGQVWKARHRRLDKLVAVKLLHIHRQASPLAVERFLREIKALGRLDHPNVVEASDAGEQAGVVYLVMKLVEGTDLARLVRERGPLPVEEACTLVRQAALGLGYLHDLGLVHRDIKPSNLIRTPDGTVKVLDLGLASWRGAGPTDELTAAGQVLGTPDFLAPEQIRDAAAVDIRADLYSLGATLFLLLTGKAPFAHRAGVYDKMEAHEEETPPDVRTLRPEVPVELAGLIARLLAKRPEDRPQTPAEVAGILAGGGDDTAEVPRELAPAAARRSRWFTPWAWAGATAGLALLLVILVPPTLFRSAPEGPSAPHDGREEAPAQAAPARGLASKQPQTPRPLRIESLEVRHFGNINDKNERELGVLGRESFVCRVDDAVKLEAKLSRRAYAYLIAYRPDGTEQVCFPDKEDERPPLTDAPRYPAPESRDEEYALTEGTGLMAFVVVASSRPLPSYRDWRKQHGTSPWKHFEAPEGVVWYDDGLTVEARTADSNVRGKGKKVPGQTPLVGLTDWLRKGPGVEAVTGVGFTVLPKEQR
jgi:hypothetical protein